MSCSLSSSFVFILKLGFVTSPPYTHTQTTSFHHQFSPLFQTTHAHNLPSTQSYKAGCGLSTLVLFNIHIPACSSTIMSLTGSLAGFWIITLIMTLPSTSVGGNLFCILQYLIYLI